MKTKGFKKNTALPWWSSLLVTTAVFVAVLLIALSGFENARTGSEAQELALVERAVERAVISCYAMEGFYPPSVDYLVENYGLEVDMDKYYIYHEGFAPNVYPTVWVVRR